MLKIMTLAGVMITLPAIIVAVAFFGRSMMLPALASLAINFLPFAVAAYLLRGKADEVSH